MECNYVLLTVASKRTLKILDRIKTMTFKIIGHHNTNRSVHYLKHHRKILAFHAKDLRKFRIRLHNIWLSDLAEPTLQHQKLVCFFCSWHCLKKGISQAMSLDRIILLIFILPAHIYALFLPFLPFTWFTPSHKDLFIN